MPRRQTFFVSLAALALLVSSACSESILYSEEQLKGKAPALVSNMQDPNTASPIDLTLANTGDVGGRDPLQILFDGQNLDPYVIQSAGNKVILDLRLTSEQTEPDKHENKVHAELRILLKDNQGHMVVSRDFVSDTQLTLRIENADDGVDNNENDSMSGWLKSTSGPATRLAIHATRTMSLDSAAAARNPWREGSLSLDNNGESVVLGHFEGFSH
jgi:hypothetical protein